MGSQGVQLRRAVARPQVGAAISAIRVDQWLKNAFVLVPLLFSGRFREASPTVDALLTFGGFCLMASAGYLLNDLVDVQLDRMHPLKRERAIASGRLDEGVARALAVLLALMALLLGFAAEPKLAGLVAIYGAATAAYTLALKRLVIIDVMAIAGLFLLRVYAGAVAADVKVSQWLLICTGMLALLLGFGKRRQEAISEQHDPAHSRPVLEHYSLPFLDQMVSLVTAGLVISYLLYANNSPLAGSQMFVTVPPALYGVFRYLYLIYHDCDTRDTATLLLRDPGMLIAAVVWLAVAAIVVYA